MCVTALHTVAQQVGTNRILIADGKFHYPFGNPELNQEKEFSWRQRSVKAALTILAKPVEDVTVFSSKEVLG